MDKKREPVKEGWLRETMPKVASMVDERRRDWGSDHVKECIGLGMKGQPDQFYAMEAGHIVGTPFDPKFGFSDTLIRTAMLVGGAFMVMRQPKEEGGDGKA